MRNPAERQAGAVVGDDLQNTGADAQESPDAQRLAHLAATLKRGDRSEEVKDLQRLLGIKDDGIYGRGTEKAMALYRLAAPREAGTLGLLTPLMETSRLGVDAVFTVSTGRLNNGQADPGSVSYGPWQLSSKAGTATSFVNSSEATQFRSFFTDQSGALLAPGTAAFTTAYNEAARFDAEGLFNAQREFMIRTHYEPVAARAAEIGLNVSDRGVQEALFSQSTQHGPRGNSTILETVAKNYPDIANMSPKLQIEALYAERSTCAIMNTSLSSDVFYNRYYFRQNEVGLAKQVSDYYQRY